MITVALLLALTTPAPSVPSSSSADPEHAAAPMLTLTVTKTETNTGAHVVLKNHGKQPIVVVVPGDGSEAGWRTPILTWTYAPLDAKAKKAGPAKPIGRCGMMNPIAVTEVVSVAAGKELVVDSWVGIPTPPGPGRWSATLTWQNDPTLGQKGGAIDDEAAAAAVAASDAFTVVAAPVTVTVP